MRVDGFYAQRFEGYNNPQRILEPEKGPLNRRQMSIKILT